MTSAPIDLHCHLIPAPELSLQYLPVQFGTAQDEDEVLYHGASVGPVRRLLTDPAVALQEMDRTGIQRRAMSVAPLSYRYDLPGDEALRWHRSLNDAIVDACAADPARLVPVGIVPLQNPEGAAEEVRRAAERRGVRAFEIGTHIAGRNLDDEALEPFWSIVEALDVALFIHPEHTPNPRWSRYYLVNLLGNPVETAVAVSSLIFGGVVDRHPRLRFWLAHGGGVVPSIVGRLRHGWKVRKEPKVRGCGDPLALLERNFWFDSLTHDPGVLKALADRFGADRIVLGSDAPFDMGDVDPLQSIAEAMDENGVHTVAHTGAVLLGLEGADT